MMQDNIDTREIDIALLKERIEGLEDRSESAAEAIQDLAQALQRDDLQTAKDMIGLLTLLYAGEIYALNHRRRQEQ